MGDLRRLLPAAVIAAALLAGCLGAEQRPLRIGVVVDCTGIYRPLEDAELAGAALPLVERGARLRGRRAADGLEPHEVAGRPVELVPGCTEAFEFSTLTAELRRLAEHDDVDVIVAANSGPDEVVMREVAARYPRIAFVAVAHGPREVTLHRAAPNLYRFAADHGQGVAGLAEHAYRRLGWRRAAVVAANWDAGWGSRDAFTAEFCALGGAIAADVAVNFFDPKGSEVARIPGDVDGVAVFAPGFFGPAGFMRRLARRVGEPAREIVVGPGLIDDPVLLRQTARALDGVAGSSNIDHERLPRYLRAFARAFPGVPASVAGSDQVSGYRDAVEAVLQGLEQAEGDPARLPRELARLRVELLGGRLHLDADRQAVVSTRLVRISAAAGSRQTPLGTVAGVDQSIGGLLERTATPSDTPASCRRGRRPPPWAR